MSQLLQFYKSFQQARAPANKPAPTFEDLTIDDKLNEHQRLIRYAKSSIGLQRLVHVKMISDVATNIGFDKTVETIVPLLEPLSKDSEPVVKQHLVEQLRMFAKFCCSSGGDVGYRILLDTLLPITARLLEDEKLEVRQAASMTLVEIAQYVKVDDVGQYVLTVILRLAHEDDKEEMRMTAAQLLNLLAELLGQDLCRQFVIPEVVSLAEDPVFRVRKSAALNFHWICKVGGEHELLERLMPAFVRLSKDDMYRVRRACAESLSEISKNVSEDIRLGVLIEIFLRLIHDPSKLVKQSVLQQSGMFIATLPGRAVNETILSQYCSLTGSPTGDVTVDTQLRHICAYSIPAVLQVIGKNRWKELREVYHDLAQSRNSSIKQTLAYSLHEVAHILDDEQIVEEELVPVFEDMIQDVEVVQMGVIKHLAVFLKNLPELCRVSYLPILHDILHSTNPFNWRLRQHLAFQLPELVKLPPKFDAFRTMFPTVMTLLQDPVVSVRRETFKGVSSLIVNVYEVASNKDDLYTPEQIDAHSLHLEELIKAINSFIVSPKCQIRQLWLELSLQLLKDLPKVVFENHFLHGILSLVCDRVANVRLALAGLLVGWAPEFVAPWDEKIEMNSSNPWTWLLKRTDIKTCVDRLRKDDIDVYNNISVLRCFYNDIAFEPISCRGKRSAPGGELAVEVNNTAVVIFSEHCVQHDSISAPRVDNNFDYPRSDNNRSNGTENFRSRSSSIDYSSEETRLRRLSTCDDGETDDLQIPNSYDSQPTEKDFVTSFADPDVVEELDIIDGLYYKHDNENEIASKRSKTHQQDIEDSDSFQ